jgi:starch synthase (maltosyl-transferring)
MENGQIRTYINAVWPEIDNGRFPIKRVVGETVAVKADITADGHDILRASLLYKHEKQSKWNHVEMFHFENDSYHASFSVERQGFYEYRIVAWIDYAYTWRYGLKRKYEDGQDVSVELKDGLSFLFELKSFVKTRAVAILRKEKKLFKGGDQPSALKQALSH